MYLEKKNLTCQICLLFARVVAFFVLKARRGFTKPVQESSVQDPSRPGAKDCNGGSEKRPQLFKRYKKSRDILYPLVAWSMSIVKVAGTWLVGQSIKPKVKVTKPRL